MKQGRGRSAREIRRMMERRDRKEQDAQKMREFWALPESERNKLLKDNAAVKRIQQNGITMKDLNDEFDKGFNQGYRNGADNAIMTCYAGICLVLKDLHGFGKKRCVDVLRALDERILYSLTGIEAVEDVFKTMGITLHFEETFPEDRVAETEEKYARDA